VARIADCSIIFLGHHQMSIEKSLVSSGKSLYQEDFYAAREDTVRKYQLAADLFPIESPFTLAEILDSDYLP